MTATEAPAAPVIKINEIPRYFGGGEFPEGSGTTADYRLDHALEALIALTGRGDDDPAIKLIVGRPEDAHGELLSMACNFGSCVPDDQPLGIDEWDDDVLFEVTGHRRKAGTPPLTHGGWVIIRPQRAAPGFGRAVSRAGSSHLMRGVLTCRPLRD